MGQLDGGAPDGLGSLHEVIDTTTPGSLVPRLGALAEFERALISDRTQAGSQRPVRGAARAGAVLLNADKRALAVRLYNERDMPISKICRMMGISKPTLYSYVRAANGVTESPAAK